MELEVRLWSRTSMGIWLVWSDSVSVSVGTGRDGVSVYVCASL